MKLNKVNIVILGSTGSIGKQALDVVDKYADRFKVVGLAAKNEVNDLLNQVEKYKPKVVAVSDEKAYKELKQRTSSNTEIVAGIEGLCALASMDEADMVLVAVSGAVGIMPTLAAIKAKKRIGLANKETLVAAGDIVMSEVNKNGVSLIPVDSEHSAIFQCMAGEEKYVKKIWLTASGGPFRDYSNEELKKVTVEMALNHPNWAMGSKITIDSASLMNKGLEVIEAHHLFAVEYDAIAVLVQKESIIHSMVEMVDGSFLAHLGTPDMRIPIQYAMTYPERMESLAGLPDFASLGAIHFSPPDTDKFPSLDLAYQAGKTGGTLPAVLNAANEVAVHSFLNREMGFTQIPIVIERVMEKHQVINNPSLDMILECDRWAREYGQEVVSTLML